MLMNSRHENISNIWNSTRWFQESNQPQRWIVIYHFYRKAFANFPIQLCLILRKWYLLSMIGRRKIKMHAAEVVFCFRYSKFASEAKNS